MWHKSIFLFFLVLLTVNGVTAQGLDCPNLVETALAHARNACSITGRNQACYGYDLLEAELSPGLTQFAFNHVGDITPVNTIHSLRLSPLDLDNDEWGIVMMRLATDIPDTYTNPNVTLVAFGSVALEADTSGQYQPMQAFTFSSHAANASTCTNVTEDGLLIQTPEGVGRVTLWINQVKIRIGSTVLFQAQPNGDMTVSTFEGSALVEAFGQVQEAAAGMQVRVPMNAALQPAAPPVEAQPFDTASTSVAPLLSVSQFFTDGRLVEPRQVEPTMSTTALSSTMNQLIDTENWSAPVEGAVEPPAAPPPEQNPPDTDHVATTPTVVPTDGDTPPPNKDDPTAETVVPTPVTPVDTGGDSDLQDDVITPAPTTAMTDTPVLVATPPQDTDSATPTVVSTPPTPDAADETSTPDDCNRDNGQGKPNGNCYGHTK